jgi:hypothetical protein
LVPQSIAATGSFPSTDAARRLPPIAASDLVAEVHPRPAASVRKQRVQA